MWSKKVNVLLEMIKFKLTVFGLPFALMGVFLAARGFPHVLVLFWVVLAVFGARTAAMGFNRIVDYRFDAANPRTAGRALPAGEVSLTESWILVGLSSVLFFASCAMLNTLALLISPLALGLAFFYSLTKRFTRFCHLFLGCGHFFAPLGGWVAVAGSLDGYPWTLSFGVLFWVAGFDCIYACLDADFDKTAGLYSMPSTMGRRNSFRFAVFFHVLAFILFILTGLQTDLNFVYYTGIIVTGCILFYQHLIVTPRDLSQIKGSFFSLNGVIALTLFAATCLSLATAG